jgi:hypothetical protein
MFAENLKVTSIIFNLLLIEVSGHKLLTEVQDGATEATLCFSLELWSQEVDNLTRSIADLLESSTTLYAYDRELKKIIVTFQR